MVIDRASQCRGLQHGRSANLEEAALRPVQRKKKERVARNLAPILKPT